MPGLGGQFPYVLRGGDEDDDGGACDADEEENIQQAHSEENDGHRKKCTADAGEEVHGLKGEAAPDGRLRLA